MSPPKADEGLYLYAIAKPVAEHELRGVSGQCGQPVTVIEHGGLAAVVSAVPLDEFGENGLSKNLEDLGWLEEVARTHDAVVREIAERSAAAPLRLATVYLDEDSVRNQLETRRDALEGALSRIEGCKEWSVKAFATTAPQDSPEAMPDDSLARGAGSAYLARRKAQTQQAHQSAAADDALGSDLHTRLCRYAKAGRRLLPQDPRLTGHEDRMILNGAYLVAEADAHAFRLGVEQLAGTSTARLEIQGPWPPYSFVELDDSGAALP